MNSPVREMNNIHDYSFRPMPLSPFGLRRNPQGATHFLLKPDGASAIPFRVT
jgi:hypothetical protein